MFKRENILYEVGDIIVVCWSKYGINNEVRGRLVEVKTDINKQLQPRIKFIVNGYLGSSKNKKPERLSFVLTDDLYIQKA